MQKWMTVLAGLVLGGCSHGWVNMTPNDSALGQATKRYEGDSRAKGIIPSLWPRCVVLENTGPSAPIAFSADDGSSQYHPSDPIATGGRVIMHIGPGGVRFRFYGRGDYPAPREVEVMDDCEPGDYPGAPQP